MSKQIQIADRLIGPRAPCFIVAEVSANHVGSRDRAEEIIRAAAASGADAVKLQTYTADTMTLPSDAEPFRVRGGPWDGYRLYDLYEEAHTPWEWHSGLFELARSLGLICFSTPFDATAVDFLKEIGQDVYKIASFELTDLPLLRKVASTGKPVIFSTGMANLQEIASAVNTLRKAGANELAGLRCVSSYPAKPAEFDLATIPNLATTFDIVAGLSDHSPGHTVAVAATALGASVIEKHLCCRRSDGGPDAGFSMEPDEFRALVDAVRETEAAVGCVRYGPGAGESANLTFRRSLFVVRDIASGEPLTASNIRAIRPGHGLAPNDLDRVLGRRATRALAAGTPLEWSAVGEPAPGTR